MSTKHLQKGVRSRIADELYTCCAFCIAVSALPALAFSYVVVRISKHLWLKVLSSRYSRLEFIKTDTVRSLLDTHRNQGIINVLLSINGPLEAERVKQQLTEHVIDRRDNTGELMFPRLRHQLVSCWGNYAWNANGPFRADNHFIVANPVYRGRPVGDNNIQEYVSEVVSKYFPSDQPPWQYIIIPCNSPEPKFYILVRVHHLLLTGNKSINIGDLLLVDQLKPSNRMPTNTEYTQESPLTKLFPAASAIPELWGKLNENISNTWNEFVSEYDPVESPRALKTLPGAFHVAGLVLISGISALRELTKKRTNGRSQAPITATTLLATMQRECKRRNLTIPKIIISPLITADPRKWPRRAIESAVTTIRGIVTFPLRVRDELIALSELKATGHAKQPHTLTWRYAELAQLCVQAGFEAWHGLMEIYRAPAQLWSDVISADDGHRNMLQTVSLCGRKVAAWSRPVNRAGVERTARALGVSSSDLALFAATEALRAFFEQSQSQPPEVVLTTARAASEDFLFTFAEGHGKMYKKSQTGGMVCLSLPLGASARRVSCAVSAACGRQRALAAAWAAQARCGALTRALPSPIARLALNLLSRRYAVSYAEINAPPDAGLRTTLWGQTIDHLIYWRPPQANISMSLTVIQYGPSVRLSVMTDARLSPAHAVPAARWPAVLEQLVDKVDQEIARIEAQTLPRVNIVAAEDSPDVSAPESSGALKLPETIAVSPPPLRRRITHH